MNKLEIFLHQHPRLFDLAKRIKRKIGAQPPFFQAIDEFSRQRESLTFLQIGANDGLTRDPYREFLIRPNARGIVMEPVPEYFRKCTRNYSAYPNVTPVNCAVGYPSGELSFYAFSEDYLTSRGQSAELAGMAGFSYEKLLLGLREGDKPEECIHAFPVPLATVEELMEKHQFTTFDCLFMDCEGFEENILMGIDYAKVQPKLIAFEHTHFSGEKPRHEEHLEGMGYKIEKYRYDAIAIKV